MHGPAQGWCFDLPELPTGREILLNILNTWGDQFYVGLTGIEVFTSSGEAALVTQVCVGHNCQLVLTLSIHPFLPSSPSLSSPISIFLPCLLCGLLKLPASLSFHRYQLTLLISMFFLSILMILELCRTFWMESIEHG